MKTSAPVQATIDTLQAAINFASSSHLFLSIYLSSSAGEITTEGIRLKLTAMLDELSQNPSGTPWQESLREERKAVEGYVRSLRPGGPGLVILSSSQTKMGGAVAPRWRSTSALGLVPAYCHYWMYLMNGSRWDWQWSPGTAHAS